MNSYPIEFLAQLAPVMFVAGLGVEPSPKQPADQPAASKSPSDAFSILCSRLREALSSQRKVAVWQPDKSKVFQVALVDKDAAFPPRKLVGPEDPHFSTSHSPLSPLTPSSPLYPDGLIAPIWLRKHTTLLPSVFVLFLRIFELPPTAPRSPLDAPDADKQREREQEERRKDTELAAEVAARKRSTTERGIKLTVVLMASRRMLDDPSLDARLTFIRRQGGLDSRASLFVLSPVTLSELGDFVQSLQQALYEPALDYYVAQSKRVRRKRNRHSQAASGSSSSVSAAAHYGLGHAPARPLRPEGWTVRYEYKMACFAEFRGEDDVALKHYQDAYSTLVNMFQSTAILPPRTKRWAEAKVLADSISIKICKLYLYNNEHSLAQSQHAIHGRKFADLARGWGIGEETFEYWSGMARQQRAFAELLEQGLTRGPLVLPSYHQRLVSAAASSSSVNVNSVEGDAMKELGMNPSQALHHPGFYYHVAARCTEVRRERFLAAFEAESTQAHNSAPLPGYDNEKRINHLAVILELYTKAYELFKKYSAVSTPGSTQTQSRLTLFVAHRIAQTYFQSGTFDMAVRFFERIAKTYRKEKWTSLLRPLLSTWYACEQQLGHVELSARLLVEMLGCVGPRDEEAATVVQDLLQVLKTPLPLSQEELPAELPVSTQIFDVHVLFWAPEVNVGDSVAFQLSVTAPALVGMADLPITSLLVEFADDIVGPVVVYHADAGAGDDVSPPPSSSSVRIADLGHISASKASPVGVAPKEVRAHLRWQPMSTLVLVGTMSSDYPCVLKISRLVLTLQGNGWHADVPIEVSTSSRGPRPVPIRWVRSLDAGRIDSSKHKHHSSVIVRHRPHSLHVSMRHEVPAYLDEEYPIVIDITNADDRELDLTVDILLQPTEIDDCHNSMRMNGETSTGLIKGVPLGVVKPGMSTAKTLHLLNNGAAGDRMIDISVQSRSTATSSEPPSPGSSDALSDVTETLKTLTIPAVAPFEARFDVRYKRSLGQRVPLADLETYDDGPWKFSQGAEAVVTLSLECVGPWTIAFEGLRLVQQASDHAQIINRSSAEALDLSLDEYLPGDKFSDMCHIAFSLDEDHSQGSDPIPGPGEYEIVWSRVLPNGERGPESISHVPLPTLQPPIDKLIALLSVPPSAKLHVPIMIQLLIRNNPLSQTASVKVQLETEPSDGFVVVGLRSGHVPLLLPGSEEKQTWKLIPVECGHVKVPRVKVFVRWKMSADGAEDANAEEEEREVVELVNVMWAWSRESLESSRVAEGDSRQELRHAADFEQRESSSTILVLP